jgi:hypothetical protein
VLSFKVLELYRVFMVLFLIQRFLYVFLRWIVKTNENNSINHSEGMSSFFCYFFLFSLLLGLFLFYSEVCFSLFFKEV